MFTVRVASPYRFCTLAIIPKAPNHAILMAIWGAEDYKID